MPRPRPRDRFGRPLPPGAPDEMPDRVDPAAADMTVREAFRRGVDLFDDRRFFEAHEHFEHIWKSEEVPPSDRDFWKGVTQVAVGCCHVQRGNAKGALALLARAARYLGRYPVHHRGVDREALVALAEKVVDRVRVAGPSPDVPFPAFPRADDAARPRES